MFEKLAIGQSKSITNDKLMFIGASNVVRTTAGWTVSINSLVLPPAGQKWEIGYQWDFVGGKKHKIWWWRGGRVHRRELEAFAGSEKGWRSWSAGWYEGQLVRIAGNNGYCYISSPSSQDNLATKIPHTWICIATYVKINK